MGLIGRLDDYDRHFVFFDVAELAFERIALMAWVVFESIGIGTYGEVLVLKRLINSFLFREIARQGKVFTPERSEREKRDKKRDDQRPGDQNHPHASRHG